MTCRETLPRTGFQWVRLPGEKGFRRREIQWRDGVELYWSILPGLLLWAKILRVSLAAAVGGEGLCARVDLFCGVRVTV